MSENKDIVGSKYPSNSNKTRDRVAKPTAAPEVKQITKVTTGLVTTKKKSFGKKLSEIFIGDDVGSVSQYIIYDVLIPAAKATLSDMIGGGIEMLLFGEQRKTNRLTRDKGRSIVNYQKFSEKPDYRRSAASAQNRDRHDFDDIIIETRGEAEDVLGRLVDLVDAYGVATVADLYQLVGMTGSGFTDAKYGWDNLSSASVSRVRNGYLIVLPRAMPVE
jgi:hypothetical protein